MNMVKNLLCKIGHLLLNVVRILRKAICCRRRKEAEYLLPMTIGHVIDMEHNRGNTFMNSDFKSEWDNWPENETSSSPMNSGNIRTDKEPNCQSFQQENNNQEDFFKDMVPQIRKPKKLYIQNDLRDSEDSKSPLNRLSMDPKVVLTGSDLGVIDDNPSNWEDIENSEELWDPDVLIREKKRAEREMKLAEHQRRKQEKESKRASRPESLSSMVVSLSDSKDKAKYS